MSNYIPTEAVKATVLSGLTDLAGDKSLVVIPSRMLADRVSLKLHQVQHAVRALIRQGAVDVVRRAVGFRPPMYRIPRPGEVRITGAVGGPLLAVDMGIEAVTREVANHSSQGSSGPITVPVSVARVRYLEASHVD